MTITKKKEADTLLIAIDGKLNTSTAPQLDTELKASLTGIKTLILDFKDLKYVSSAGLRVILSTQKIMNKQGKMIVKNVSSDIMEIFEISGFSAFMNIE